MRLSLLIIASIAAVRCDKEREMDGATSRLGRHHQSGGSNDEDHHDDHQAILGSRKAAEAFDSLSDEESKSRLHELAKQMDLNKDGFVDSDELTKWIEKSMKSLDNEEASERMKDMDVDGDGFVTWKEVQDDGFPNHDSEILNEEDRKLMEQDEMYFKAADVNGDGKLDSVEVFAFVTPENYEHMFPTLINVTLFEKDLNGDNAIDVHEFLGEIADQPKSEWNAVERERFAKHYDKNGDGVLTGSEIREWLIPNVEGVARQEAQHLISNSDKNQDGKLTYAEIVNQHKLFVGSEATNYGESLSTGHDEF